MAPRNEEPLARVGRSLVDAVVEEAQRAVAEDVGHEMPPGAIERVEKRTRSLELLDLADHGARPRLELVLRDPVRPDHAENFRLAPVAEAEMRHRTVRDAIDVELLRLSLHFG